MSIVGQTYAAEFLLVNGDEIMQVILQEKINKLGTIGDQVSVKAGYARNYLIPQNKAIAATKQNIASFEARRAELEKIASEKIAAAKERAEKIAALELVIEAKAGEGGKLFGSIGPRDVAEAISSMGITLEKREVNLPGGPIRMTGDYDVNLNLHSEVALTVQLKVAEA